MSRLLVLVLALAACGPDPEQPCAAGAPDAGLALELWHAVCAPRPDGGDVTKAPRPPIYGAAP